jgi:hypothetical protein
MSLNAAKSQIVRSIGKQENDSKKENPSPRKKEPKERTERKNRKKQRTERKNRKKEPKETKN